MKKILFVIVLMCAFSTASAQLNIHAPWAKANFKGGKISCFAAIGNSVIFAATSKGIHVSENNGGAWSYVMKLPSKVKVVNAMQVSGPCLVIYTPQGVFLKRLQSRRMY